jgi:hypothetical protein
MESRKIIDASYSDAPALDFESQVNSFMQSISFVSTGCIQDGTSFLETAESVFKQLNKQWNWLVDEKLFSVLENNALKNKMTADQRVLILNSESVFASLNLLEVWGTVFLHSGFSISSHFTDEIIKHNEAVGFDLLYTDLQLLNDDDTEEHVFRRPHRCVERLLHQNYVSGALAVKKHVLEEVFAQGVTALNEIEARAICNVVKRNGAIRHVFEPIVRARRSHVEKQMLTGSPEWLEAASSAVETMQQGFVHAPGPTGKLTIRRSPKKKVSISVVIPTRGDKKRIWGIETDLIENVVKSLLDKTSIEDFEVVVVHDVNASYGKHIKSFERYGNRVKTVPYEKPFNFSEKCNVGALHSAAEIIVLLNDDIEVIDPWWLDHLVGYLELSEVGAVGPLLLLDNGLVQTAGHVNEPLPANYFSGKPIGLDTFPEPLDIPCEVSGLTAACLAVRRDVFDEVGGFCEDLPNNFNDVDFCLKIQGTGRTLIWTPLARLYHFEATTRITTVTEEETQFIKDRWGRTFGVDLYRSRID